PRVPRRRARRAHARRGGAEIIREMGKPIADAAVDIPRTSRSRSSQPSDPGPDAAEVLDDRGTHGVLLAGAERVEDAPMPTRRDVRRVAGARQLRFDGLEDPPEHLQQVEHEWVAERAVERLVEGPVVRGRVPTVRGRAL